VQPRSKVSHDHFFSAVHEAWKNLPEHIAKRWPSPDHLRKWALVKAGFCSIQEIACSSHKQAEYVGANIRRRDGYAVIVVRGSTVRICDASSQSTHAMGGKEFQRSKTAVLEIIANLINVSPQELEDHSAGQKVE